MTSIEWLLSELEKVNYHPTEAMIMYANKLHKQEIIDAQSYAVSNADMTNNKGYFDCDKYYQETFVSKGSDDTLKDYHIVEMVEPPQQEISDEEIEKAVMDSMDYVYLNPNDSLIFHQGWMRAIKWYIEQLKQKQ